MGRRARGLAKGPCSAGQAGARLPGDHGADRCSPVQFRSHHAPDLAGHADGHHRSYGGLLLTGFPFGFMALLGTLALGGELIKNQIVVLRKIVSETEKGKPSYTAIL